MKHHLRCPNDSYRPHSCHKPQTITPTGFSRLSFTLTGVTRYSVNPLLGYSKNSLHRYRFPHNNQHHCRCLPTNFLSSLQVSRDTPLKHLLGCPRKSVFTTTGVTRPNRTTTGVSRTCSTATAFSPMSHPKTGPNQPHFALILDVQTDERLPHRLSLAAYTATPRDHTIFLASQPTHFSSQMLPREGISRFNSQNVINSKSRCADSQY